MIDATERFGGRVADYQRYRPGYPPALVDWLIDAGALAAGGHVVDLGCGTGLLSAVFLDAGLRVTGVEPNAPMREAGQAWLGTRPAFDAVAGTAEATGLPDRCCDLVVAGQAFHWFDPDACRAECLRIAHAPAHAAMIWNERRLGTPFMDDYEALLLAHCPEYRAIMASHVDQGALSRFFQGDFRRHSLPNHQRLDFAALRGRLMSSSYAPMAGAPGHDALVQALADLFSRHALDGCVQIDYRTVIIVAPLVRAN